VKVLDHVQHGGRWTRHEQQMNSLHDQVLILRVFVHSCKKKSQFSSDG